MCSMLFAEERELNIIENLWTWEVFVGQFESCVSISSSLMSPTNGINIK